MSNILVHQITGEVIHIDFGVVFEQGKVSSYRENNSNDCLSQMLHSRHISNCSSKAIKNSRDCTVSANKKRN
jgi:phosphatidylinositol kinase/protein kinase (PI-3  family)